MENTNNQVYWKRVGYVAIEDDEHNMIRYGGSEGNALDFKFSADVVMNVAPRFNVSILGLSFDTIKKLTVWNNARALMQGRKIAVYAGYEKDNISMPIINGIVYSAIPTNPPEMWLNISGICGLSKSVPISKPIQMNDTMLSIANAIAKLNEMKCEWHCSNPDGSKTVRFTLEGNTVHALYAFCKQFGLSYVINYDVIEIFSNDITVGTIGKNEDSLSVDNGMIGVPKISMKGMEVSRRLNTTLSIGDTLNVKSQLVPSTSGPMIVSGVHYEGHFRGQEWTTTLECTRKRFN